MERGSGYAERVTAETQEDSTRSLGSRLLPVTLLLVWAQKPVLHLMFVTIPGLLEYVTYSSEPQITLCSSVTYLHLDLVNQETYFIIPKHLSRLTKTVIMMGSVVFPSFTEVEIITGFDLFQGSQLSVCLWALIENTNAAKVSSHIKEMQVTQLCSKGSQNLRLCTYQSNQSLFVGSGSLALGTWDDSAAGISHGSTEYRNVVR